MIERTEVALLVLQRNIGESIIIDDIIVVTLAAVEDERAKVKVVSDIGCRSIWLEWNEPVEIAPGVQIRYSEMRSPVKIRIGIEAPREMEIWRNEVYKLLKRENRAGRAKAE